MKKTISVGSLFNMILKGEQPKCVTYNREPIIWNERNQCYQHVSGLPIGVMLRTDSAHFLVEYDVPILDRLEKRYLSDVIRPFRSRIRGIKKKRHGYSEHIEVYVTSGAWINVISFPEFKARTMYEGMEAEKEYTLKELGL